MVVLPADKPDTTPDGFTVPNAGLVLLHTPLPVPSVKFVVPDTHTAGVPLMLPAFGNPFTVTNTVAADEQPSVVTV